MRYRKLGRTGLEVGVVGVGGSGAMGVYGDVTPEGFSQMLSRATELGFNLLDTAPAYGDSEAVFGYHLKDHRADWIVCTKVGHCGPPDGSKRDIDPHAILADFPGSLQRLNTDHVDILLIHSLEQYGAQSLAAERLLMRGGLVDQMRKLQAEGRVRFIGVSGHVPELVHAAATGQFDVILTYNSFNLLVQEADAQLFDTARQGNLGVLLGGPLYQGMLAGNMDQLIERKARFFEQSDPAYYRTDQLVERVKRLLAHHHNDGRALRQSAIRYSLSHPAVSVLLSAMNRTNQVEENAATVDLPPLTDSEITALLAV